MSHFADWLKEHPKAVIAGGLVAAGALFLGVFVYGCPLCKNCPLNKRKSCQKDKKEHKEEPKEEKTA